MSSFGRLLEALAGLLICICGATVAGISAATAFSSPNSVAAELLIMCAFIFAAVGFLGFSIFRKAVFNGR